MDGKDKAVASSSKGSGTSTSPPVNENESSSIIEQATATFPSEKEIDAFYGTRPTKTQNDQLITFEWTTGRYDNSSLAVRREGRQITVTGITKSQLAQLPSKSKSTYGIRSGKKSMLASLPPALTLSAVDVLKTDSNFPYTSKILTKFQLPEDVDLQSVTTHIDKDNNKIIVTGIVKSSKGDGSGPSSAAGGGSSNVGGPSKPSTPTTKSSSSTSRPKTI